MGSICSKSTERTKQENQGKVGVENHATLTIRTLQLDRGVGNVRPARLSIDHHSEIDEDLILISHCWGDVKKMNFLGKSVQLDDLAKVETIKELCRAWPEAHVWVDFFCILQDNDDDKILHIKLLPDLYKRAKYTATILKPAEFEVVQSALDSLKAVALAIKGKHEIDAETERLVTNARIRVSACSELEYWKRTWTLQERVLSGSMFFLPYGATADDVRTTLEEMPIIYGLLDRLPDLAKNSASLGDLLASLKRALFPGRFKLSTFEIARACFVHALKRSVEQDFVYGRLALLGINVAVEKVGSGDEMDNLLRETMRGLVEKGYLPPGVVLPANCPDGVVHTHWSKWEVDACVCHFDERMSSYFQALRYDEGHNVETTVDRKTHVPMLPAPRSGDEVVSVVIVDEWARLLPSEPEIMRNGSEKAIAALKRFETLRPTLASRVVAGSPLYTEAERSDLESALKALQKGVHPLQWNQLVPIIVKTKSSQFYGYLQHNISIPFDDGRHYFNVTPEFTQRVLLEAKAKATLLVGTFVVKGKHIAHFVDPPKNHVLTAHVIPL